MYLVLRTSLIYTSYGHIEKRFMKPNGILPMEREISVGRRLFCFYGDISSGNLYAG